ncbi:Uncharacterized protein family, partial [human gut metagenome]
MESYYLYHCGLPLGPGVGLMTLQYVFHKTTVLLYATVMLLLQHRWLAANTSGVMHYLPAAYCVVALVIVTLVLLCVSPLVQRLARWAMGFLPKTEPWQTRREKWLEQLDTLATESRLLLADKGRCARILAVQSLCLFGRCGFGSGGGFFGHGCCLCGGVGLFLGLHRLSSRGLL